MEQREIKFRGRSKNNIWFYGSYVTFLPKQDPFELTPPCREIEIVDDSGKGRFVNPFTVGQFTGLHDKNGKEIYDGDIIAVNGIQIGYIVGGVRGYCYDVIYTPAKHNGEKSWPLYSVVTRDYPNKCEVIGNIHDNPELLKED